MAVTSINISDEPECGKDLGFKPDCDCAWRHLHANGLCLDVHFEPEGDVHIILYGGEDVLEHHIEDAPTIEHACFKAIEWAMQVIYIDLNA